MSGRGHNSPKLELKLNLSPPRANSEAAESGASSSEMSPKSSCVSSESDQGMSNYASSLETSSMMLVGCPRCLMYVMLSDVNPKCPKCKSTVLLNVLSDDSTKKTIN
ncbi:hypothetical protein P3X46_000011 [Hevea brasiliensis]|uniref:GIR1-like zinc ribbon domain-containing protein n=1 Tax=Hevea brasiliensis TaxID=3981 RepID=A0ABQ9NAK1_HEVBR|nr:protein GL2-INTERACTING REPRESSOR 1 [Hevea brasiliensis]KAJ9188631.1 hypothetical protein P3X46_000011 [Hevea brasiliensis]